jgi:hypothetical protein
MPMILEDPRAKSLANGARRVSFLVQAGEWERFQRLFAHVGQQVMVTIEFEQVETHATDYRNGPVVVAQHGSASEHQEAFGFEMREPDPVDDDPHVTMTLEELEEVRQAAAEDAATV